MDMKFEELAKVNVNPHLEKKNGLSYLSWAWAVDYMTRLDPDAEWEYREWDGKPFLQLPDTTCLVYCTVKFAGKKKTCQLPVMDYKNQAIKNPNAFQINTTMQRALVKAIALHGLGLYVYAGEDVPKDEADAKDKEAADKAAKDNGTVTTKTDNRIVTSKITPRAGAKDNISPEQRQKVDDIVRTCKQFLAEKNATDASMTADMSEMDADEWVYFFDQFDSKERRSMKDAHDAEKKKMMDREVAGQI